LHAPVRLLFATALSFGLLAMGSHARAAPPPERVVSMNLCTDQLAMLVAAPGQLHSVTWLAIDPQSSAMAEIAQGLAVNHGLAEEIFLMNPDLVLAGTYATPSTVGLLRKLGIPVEEFAPENSLEDIRANIVRMGEILGQQQRARAILVEFDSALNRYMANTPNGITAATYFANSYTAGRGTLVDALIQASGMENIAARLGFAGTSRLPLEVLLLAAPDVLIDADEQPSMPALAQQNFVHPAYRRLAAESFHTAVPSKYTICGGPFTAEAIRLLRDAAHRVGTAQ
jgi:iron complex transport system substrate-binding protein